MCHMKDVFKSLTRCLAREGLLCVGVGETMSNANVVRSELLPSEWNNESGAVYSLLYQDSQAKGYLLKAVAVDSVLVFSLLEINSEKSTDLTLAPGESIEFGDNIKIVDVDDLVKRINNELIKNLMKRQDSQKASQGGNDRSQQQKANQRQDDVPLSVGGRNPRGINPGMPDYGGMYPSVGGADLDPLRSGMMGGGMLMDPRAGRGRDMEPRWDPVGPGMGGRGRGPAHPLGRGFGGRGRNFGDAMRPPDFNNDDDDDYNNMFM